MEDNQNPICRICKRQDDGIFCSELWWQIDMENPYNEHGDTLIWICPECIEKTRVCQEYKDANEKLRNENEEIAPAAEYINELEQVLLKLGIMIDNIKVKRLPDN